MTGIVVPRDPMTGSSCRGCLIGLKWHTSTQEYHAHIRAQRHHNLRTLQQTSHIQAETHSQADSAHPSMTCLCESGIGQCHYSRPPFPLFPSPQHMHEHVHVQALGGGEGQRTGGLVQGQLSPQHTHTSMHVRTC